MTISPANADHPSPRPQRAPVAFPRMAALPHVTDDRFVLEDGIWCRPDERRDERWSADAAVDPIHAAISATGTEAERIKSAPDLEFLLEQAVDGVVLDLGCGYGRVAKYLLPVRAFDGYVGIDGSLTMLELFRERYHSNELEQNTPLLLIHGSIDDIKLADASVDNVVISAVLLHNSKQVTRAVVREAHRVLRPGGRLVVLSDLPNSRTLATLPNRLYVAALELTGHGDRNGPVRPYSRAEVDALLRRLRGCPCPPEGTRVPPEASPRPPPIHQRLVPRARSRSRAAMGRAPDTSPDARPLVCQRPSQRDSLTVALEGVERRIAGAAANIPRNIAASTVSVCAPKRGLSLSQIAITTSSTRVARMHR